MGIDRRSLLQYTGFGCALAVMPLALNTANTTLRVHRVTDAVALPSFAPGDLVTADVGIVNFDGAGLYLYPSWGQPRLYHVLAAADRLEFRNPGTGVLLWTQSTGLGAAFAGRVLDRALSAAYPPLSVPSLPLHA
jgi:hypothetical protein